MRSDAGGCCASAAAPTNSNDTSPSAVESQYRLVDIVASLFRSFQPFSVSRCGGMLCRPRQGSTGLTDLRCVRFTLWRKRPASHKLSKNEPANNLANNHAHH